MSRWKLKRRGKDGKKRRRANPKNGLVYGNPAAIERACADGVTLVTAGSGGSPNRVQRVSAEDYQSLMQYLDGHGLIPFDYDFDPRQKRYQRAVAKSLAVLKTREADPTALTRALVILGHSPTEQVLATLQRWADSSHPLGGVARHALQECQDLAATRSAATADTAPFVRIDTLS